jgi:5-methyltetrahydrofolate--homocysteine methyltransferase
VSVVPRVALAAARANALAPASAPARPVEAGVQSVEIPIAALRPLIDWTPFFQAWELAGSHPRILDDATVGAQARALFADAQAMLGRIEAEGWVTVRGAFGLFPANRRGDDIVVWADEGRAAARAVLHTLRQQAEKPPGMPNLALADFVGPAGVEDWVGAFVVTAGGGVAERAAALEAENDDYGAILLKALADRLAEAAAEWLHRHVRTGPWGYAAAEALNPGQLIAEEYRGIRPAPGYPACPDHTEKATIFSLLDAPARTGVTLTESMAMWPAASVSGLYFAHPDARYFGVGKIGRDQLGDYAARKGWDAETALRWLRPVLDED